jgi:hypothetical protein
MENYSELMSPQQSFGLGTVIDDDTINYLHPDQVDERTSLLKLIRMYTIFGMPIVDLLLGYLIFYIYYDHHQQLVKNDYRVLAAIIPIVVIFNYIIDPKFRQEFKDPYNYYIVKFLFIASITYIVIA